MKEAPLTDRDRRLLVLTPTAKDAGITTSVLGAAGVSVETCGTFGELLSKLADGAAAILVAEEVAAAKSRLLSDVLARQPKWSDLPVLILTRPGADSPETAEALRTLGNVTLLERPLRVSTLVSAVKTALRARERQYQIRGHLADHARAEAQLRTADHRKDEFLATLGHELRNPLASIRTAVELIKLAKITDPPAIRACEVMDRQINHLVRLVDDLLEVSRITRGVIEVRKETLDLRTIVGSAVETSRPMFDGLAHQVSVEIPEAPIPVAGDPVRLTEVFLNLLNNAAKYTDPGGFIMIEVRQDGTDAAVTVRDNGIGIEPPLLSSVFEMFMQVDRSDRRTQGGLGIGLTLVRSLVAMHGGTVEALSTGHGAGSAFIVRLPVVAAQSVSDSGPAEPLKLFPARRILVVDDNCDAAETLGSLLETLGATVRVANSGHAALDAVERFDPDAVLLDIGMPEMDGFEVSRRIRATPKHAGVLLIALTGWGQEQDRQRSREAGFDHHLVKPPDLDKLRDLLAFPPARHAGTLM